MRGVPAEVLARLLAALTTRRQTPKHIPMPQVVELLKKAGADETIKDKEGHTAADYGYKPAGKDEEKEGDKAAGKGGEL